MLRVALTGGIATGKTYVRKRLETLGAATIDSDVLAREAVAPSTPGLAAVVERFGASVLNADGELDRARLAGIVFADADARAALEAIVHPRVRRAIDAWFEDLERARALMGVADIPLLFETGRAGAFDVVVVTWCPPATQLARIQSRDGATEDAARRRIASQWPVDEKARQADYVIRTDGSFADTDAQVDRLFEELKRRAARA